MARGGDTRAQAAASGKKVGRPAKAKVPIGDNPATPGIATLVLGMDGPPLHGRKCGCDTCAGENKRKCECRQLSDLQGEPTTKIECDHCRTRREHAICHCEVCGWWEALIGNDKRLRMETRKYLTDRRDGKPAQGVFVGDTREKVRELDFGDLPEFFAAGESGAAGKPN